MSVSTIRVYGGEHRPKSRPNHKSVADSSV